MEYIPFSISYKMLRFFFLNILLLLKLNVFSQSEKYFYKVMTVSPPWSINGIVVKQHQDSSYIIGSNKFVNNDGDNQLIHLDKYNKILLDSTYIDTNSSVGIKDLQFSHIQNHYITTGHYQTIPFIS